MNRIPLALPWLGEEEGQAAASTIASGWVTQGPKVQAFEEAFAASTGAAHACAVSSCTTALHLALLAVGVRPGDVVVTVSHSFIASANAVRHCQAEPYFVDIDPATLNLDPRALERVLEEDFRPGPDGLWLREPERLAVGESPLVGRSGPVGRLGALLVVHQVGMPAHLERILPLARAHGIPVVEDAACAIGSQLRLAGSQDWETIGRPHGDVACFSFHPRKLVTTGDGGMLTCNDAAMTERFRLWRQHGMSVSDRVRTEAAQVVFEDYLTTGFNSRMTDIQAAIGIEQLKRLPAMVGQRREAVARYRELLEGIDGLSLPEEPPYARSNWQTFIVRLADPARQRPVMQALHDRGISTRRGIMCAHLEPPYAPAWPPGCLPHSEAARDQGLTLPLFHTLTDEQQTWIATALRELLG